MVKCPDPSTFLKTHILRGDKSDGVPNILSNDNCLDEGIRQTPLRKPMLETYLRISIEKDNKYYKTVLKIKKVRNELPDSSSNTVFQMGFSVGSS
jgi:hypothetical protein